MCGRYSFAPDLRIVNEHYDISVEAGEIGPNYNCSPMQMLPVITNTAPHTFSICRWGLVPFWAKDPAVGNKLINARAETILQKPSFKAAFRQQRCLIPADAFYEWRKDPATGKKSPYRIFLKESPLFSMAGIWEQWKNREGEIIRTFSIITTSANELMAEIHNRMPVILPRNMEKAWLEINDETKLTEMLQPFPAKMMDAYRISNLVNNPKNNTPDIIKPVEV